MLCAPTAGRAQTCPSGSPPTVRVMVAFQITNRLILAGERTLCTKHLKRNFLPPRAGDLGSFTPETWIKQAARVQLTPSPSFWVAPALRGQTAKPPRLVSSCPRAADGAAGGARSRRGPLSQSDGASRSRISPAGAAARSSAVGSRARGASDAHGGPGGGIWGSVPAGAPSRWPSLEPGSRVRPEKPGGGEERAGRSPGIGAGSDTPQAEDAEDPGIPPAAQRLLRRAKGFRPTGLGPAGRNCTRSPHAATHGAGHPRRLASLDPTPGLRQLCEPGAEDREKGRVRHTRARSRGPGLRRAGARAPLQQRT